MAPEILRGEPYTEQSDIYSFGCICWEMLHHKIPFMGRSNAQITGSVGYHEQTLTFAKPEHCILKKCLSPDPSNRPNLS